MGGPEPRETPSITPVRRPRPPPPSGGHGRPAGLAGEEKTVLCPQVGGGAAAPARLSEARRRRQGLWRLFRRLFGRRRSGRAEPQPALHGALARGDDGGRGRPARRLRRRVPRPEQRVPTVRGGDAPRRQATEVDVRLRGARGRGDPPRHELRGPAHAADGARAHDAEARLVEAVHHAGVPRQGAGETGVCRVLFYRFRCSPDSRGL